MSRRRRRREPDIGRTGGYRRPKDRPVQPLVGACEADQRKSVREAAWFLGAERERRGGALTELAKKWRKNVVIRIMLIMELKQ